MKKEKRTRLEILEGSLKKKERQFDEKLQEHFDYVRSANGQPLNDKRVGAATMRRWDKQDEYLAKLDKGIKLTKGAIEREKGIRKQVGEAKKDLPPIFLDLLNEGTLKQWRKYPNRFFVAGVDKARIIWKDNNVYHKYLSQISTKEQRKLFADTYNKIYKTINDKL